MASFRSKSDSMSSLNSFLSRFDSVEDGSIFQPLSIRDFYKVFVLAEMYYPTHSEFSQATHTLSNRNSIFLDYLRKAQSNVISDRIKFIDPKIGVFDLTETLYTSHSNGRTKVTRMLFRSNPRALLGFIWLHEQGRISVIEESDERNLEAKNLDRSAFGLTASGIKFRIRSKLVKKILVHASHSKTFMYLTGKGFLRPHYNNIVRFVLRIFQMEILEKEENFVPLFYNQIFMNDYTDWNQSTLSRIKTLVNTTEVKLYMTLHDDIIHRYPYFFSDKRKSEFLSVLDLARVATNIFVPSQSEYENVKNHFTDSSKIVVVPWTGDHILQFGFHKIYSVSRERAAFLHFLGSDPRKNSLRIFQAMLMIAKKGSVFTVNIVGSMSDSALVPSSVMSDLELQGIELNFHENITEEQLAKLYSVSDCLIYCSLAEGFGLPIAEAAEMGCSVITSNFGSMLEVGNKYAQVTFANPTDVHSIEEAMINFLAGASVPPPITLSDRRTWEEVFSDILAAMGKKVR